MALLVEIKRLKRSLLKEIKAADVRASLVSKNSRKAIYAAQLASLYELFELLDPSMSKGQFRDIVDSAAEIAAKVEPDSIMANLKVDDNMGALIDEYIQHIEDDFALIERQLRNPPMAGYRQHLQPSIPGEGDIAMALHLYKKQLFDLQKNYSMSLIAVQTGRSKTWYYITEILDRLPYIRKTAAEGKYVTKYDDDLEPGFAKRAADLARNRGNFLKERFNNMNMLREKALFNAVHYGLYHKYITEKNAPFRDVNALQFDSIEKVDKLYSVLENAKLHWANREQERLDKKPVEYTPEFAAEGTEFLGADEKYKIYAVHNIGAACELGSEDWCTAYRTVGHNRFSSYYKPDDPLFIIFDKQNPEERYQFHFGEIEFVNIEDARIMPQKYEDILNSMIKMGVDKKYPVINQTVVI